MRIYGILEKLVLQWLQFNTNLRLSLIEELHALGRFMRSNFFSSPWSYFYYAHPLLGQLLPRREKSFIRKVGVTILSWKR